MLLFVLCANKIQHPKSEVLCRMYYKSNYLAGESVTQTEGSCADPCIFLVKCKLSDLCIISFMIVEEQIISLCSNYLLCGTPSCIQQKFNIISIIHCVHINSHLHNLQCYHLCVMIISVPMI